jgi:tRNA-specific 2-thiouridylase
LWGVSQESLSRTVLPLGNLTKKEIREMAKERGFFELASKAESYEICFVPDNDYRGFLKRRVDGLEERVKGGNFVMEDGTILGQHEGYPFYTIGQRKGLGIALGYPAFVTDIRKDTNEVVLGRDKQLERNGLEIQKINLLKYEDLYGKDVTVSTKIRYKHEGVSSRVTQLSNDKIRIDFDEPVTGVAPGQAAVFYEGDDVIGGGWITKSIK